MNGLYLHHLLGNAGTSDLKYCISPNGENVLRQAPDDESKLKELANAASLLSKIKHAVLYFGKKII